MSLLKENIYINLRGKSKEELTDLWEFLTNNGEVLFAKKLDSFHKYTFESYPFSFSKRHLNWCTGEVSNKTEVTIEQLKEILKPMETPRICTQEEAEAPKLVNNNNFIPMEKEFDLSMCRIIVDNPEQSKKLQELAFKQGYNWNLAGKTVTNTYRRVLYFNPENYRITLSDLDFDDSRFKTFHFTDVFKETLEQQLQKAEAEVKRLKEAIDVTKIKEGDWCTFWNHDKDKFIIAKFQGRNRFACIRSGDYLLDCEKITDSVLLESLNKLF